MKKYTWVSNFKVLLESKGVTQKEVGEATGISVSTLSKIQNNHFSRIDVNTLSKLAYYFQIDSGEELFKCIVEEES